MVLLRVGGLAETRVLRGEEVVLVSVQVVEARAVGGLAAPGVLEVGQ